MRGFFIISKSVSAQVGGKTFYDMAQLGGKFSGFGRVLPDGAHITLYFVNKKEQVAF